MKDFREPIERGFEVWARFAVRQRWVVTLSAVLFSAGFAIQVPTLEFNNSTDSFLRPTDPIRVAYDDFREQFGRDTRISIGIESESIFTLEFLDKLRALHEAVEEEVPYVDDVTSLVNARNTYGDGDTLVVGDLLEDWPETEEDVARIRELALANPLYRNTVLSADGRMTTVAILLHAFSDEVSDFDALAGFEDAGDEAEEKRGGSAFRTASGRVYLSEDEATAAVDAVEAIAERFDGPDFETFIAGAPVLSAMLSEVMRDDMSFFIGLCGVVIALTLAVLFRRPSAVVLPVLIIALSLTTTLGFVGFAGGDLTFGTQILPTFLMSVGVCDAVHILAIYYLARRRGSEKTDSIAFAFRHSALAILMTSLTTAGGIASFAAADLAPIGDLGFYGPIGVMLAFVYTIYLMPALMAILPMGSPEASTDEAAAPRGLERLLRATGIWSARHRLAILSVTAGLVVFAAVGASFVQVSHNPMDWLPEESVLRRGTFTLNDRLGGVNVIEVVATAAESGAGRDPAFLSNLESFEDYASSYARGDLQIAQTLSLLDVLRETNQALHGDDPSFYLVPDDRQLIAQELLLFEGSGTDDLEELVDTTYQKVRMSLRIPWVDALHYPAIIAEVRDEASRQLGRDVDVTLTGMVAMLSRTFESVLTTMARSYAIAVAVIIPMMMLLLGSLRLGLISMVPNLAPILLMLGYMGWSGTPIDGMTMTAGAIMLGLSVDDTIHYMHNFRRSYVASGDSMQAIDETLRGTGRALLITSIVLASGFMVFAWGYLANIRLFGVLTALTILIAFVANVVVGSALMSYASEWGIGKAARAES